MIKRIIALAITAVMCLQPAVFADAEGYEPNTIPDGWSKGYRNEQKIDKTANYVQVTKDAAYEGENSLEVCYPLGDLGDGTAIYFRNFSVAGAAAGQYTISLYVKAAKGAPLKLHLEYEGGDYVRELKYYNLPTAGIKVRDAGDGWFLYTMNANAEKPLRQFYFEIFDRIEQPVYVDGISITRKDGGENLLDNGGFESVTVESKVLKYEPVNVMVSERDGSILTPSWRNPNADAEKIRLYDITDGKNTLISDSFDTGAGKLNHCQIKQLTEEKEYLFRLEFDFGSAGVREFFISGTANSRNTYYGGGWSCNFAYGADYKYTPVWVGPDGETKHGGAAAVNVKSNLNGESGLFLEINIAFSGILEKNKKYRVSLWSKAEEMESGTVTLLMEDSRIGTIPKSGSYDWTQSVFDYDTEKNAISGCLKFWVQKSVRNLWIDDIEVYELDSDGNTTGDNLVPNSEVAGFEKGFDGSVPPGVSDVKAEPLSRQAKISWTKPASSVCDKVRIYQEIDGETVLRGVLPATQSEITLSKLENESEYTYIIKTASKYGVESEGSRVTVSPVTPEAELLPLVINGGTDSLNLGTNTFEMTAMNNFSAEELKVELIAALLKNDGKELAELKSTQASLVAGESAELKTELSIPNDGNAYTVKLFVWDGLFSLNSLQKTVTLELAN